MGGQSIGGESEQNARERLMEPVGMAVGADGKSYAVSRLDVIGQRWRRAAVEVLRIADPDGYAEYRRLKYGPNGEHENPDLATRRKAYAFAARRFLECVYGIPGF